MSNNIKEEGSLGAHGFNKTMVVGRDVLTETLSFMDADADGKLAARGYVWDTATLAWVAAAAPDGVPTNFDTIDITYTGDNATGIVYSLDAAPVSTLTLTYVGDKLTKVVRS